MFIRKKDYKYLIIIILLTMLFIFVGLNDISM